MSTHLVEYEEAEKVRQFHWAALVLVRQALRAIPAIPAMAEQLKRENPSWSHQRCVEVAKSKICGASK